MRQFAPAVRYIKLGQKNAWADDCLNRGVLQMAHAVVPHELCKRRRWGQVTARFIEAGHKKGKASDFTRELQAFYTLGPDCLWVTFARGFLWWAFAKSEVSWIGEDGSGSGCRERKIIGNWSNKDLKGRLLRSGELSSRLTMVMGYRQTLCEVSESDDLKRRIKGDEPPIVATAQAAKQRMIEAAHKMIAGLHWKDFESLVDLIFARNGWQRVSPLGNLQKDIDLEVLQPLIGTRAGVQIKSRASQKDFDRWLKRFKDGSAYDRLFFACHSPKGQLQAPRQSRVDVWVGDRLADIAVQSGLYDWLLQRSI